MIVAALRTVEESEVNPGFLGFLVVALLGVATWLLLRSMMYHLRRIDLVDAQQSDEAPAAAQTRDPEERPDTAPEANPRDPPA